MFQTFAELSLDEIRRLCVKRARSSFNMSHDTPHALQHRHLLLKRSRAAARLFFILPGGHHAVVAWDDGVVDLFDVSLDGDLESAGADTSFPAVGPASLETWDGAKVGQRLARFKPMPCDLKDGMLVGLDFVVNQAEGTITVVTISAFQ